MSQPVCYILTMVIYDMFLLNATSFTPLDFALPVVAFLFLQSEKKRLIFWLLGLNLFLVFVVVSYLLNGDLALAKSVFIRTNLILLLALSLFFGRHQYFFIKAASSLKFPQKLIAILIIQAKLFDDLTARTRQIPRTIKARGVRNEISLFTYKSYANLVGKMIVDSLDRSFEIYTAMRVRGYVGYINFIDAKRANAVEILLLVFCVLNAIFRINL